MKNEQFPKIGEIQGIQQAKNVPFSAINGHFSASEASYRRISAYTKSVTQYKHERELRHQVRVLAEKGLTQNQIATKLGVSTRTVKRDWNKIRAYVEGQFRKKIRQL